MGYHCKLDVVPKVRRHLTDIATTALRARIGVENFPGIKLPYGPGISYSDPRE